MKWREVAFALLLLALVTSMATAAFFRGVAREAAERGAAMTEEIERYRAVLSEDSARVARAEIALEEARADALERVGELEAARRAERAASDSLDAALASRADSLGGMIPFTEHLDRLAIAERALARSDSIAAIQTERAERAEAHIAEVLGPRITALTAQVARLEARDTVRLREIEALRAAANASPGLLSVNIGADWWKFAAGAALGYLATR